MPEIPYGGVQGNDATDEHLWRHGLTIWDADDVWEGPAKYFDQDAKLAEELGLGPQGRPERIVMIGPDKSGRMLTIILEPPDFLNESHVVTGWVATRGERSRYHQPGGRMRRR